MSTSETWLRGGSREPVRSRALPLVEAALGFANDHIGSLERHSGFWDDRDDPYVSPADKVVVETALLALIVSRVPNLPVSVQNTVDSLARQIDPLARCDRNKALLMRHPHTAASLGIAHVILTILGLEDPLTEKLFQRAMASGQVDAMERLPYRGMDLRWLRGIADRNSAGPNFDDLIPHSIVSSHAHPISMSVADTYALTHALMYITDFGQQQLPASVDHVRVASMVGAGIAWHVVSGNLDLLGELLLASVLLGSTETPSFRLGWEVLAHTWSDMGCLPSPTFDVASYTALSGDAAASYAFRHTYHTTYVGGILCAVMLDQRQPVIVGDDRDRPGQPWSELAASCEVAATAALEYCLGHDALATGALTPSPLPDGSDSPLPVTQVSPDVAGGSREPMSFIIETLRAHEYASSNASLLVDSDLAWLQTVSALSDDELAAVLADALVISAGRAYHLEDLASVIVEIARSRLPLSHTVYRAAVFLLQQQLPSGAIGADLVSEHNGQTARAVITTAGLAQRLSELAELLRKSTRAEAAEAAPGPYSAPVSVPVKHGR